MHTTSQADAATSQAAMVNSRMRQRGSDAAQPDAGSRLAGRTVAAGEQQADSENSAMRAHWIEQLNKILETARTVRRGLIVSIDPTIVRHGSIYSLSGRPREAGLRVAESDRVPGT